MIKQLTFTWPYFVLDTLGVDKRYSVTSLNLEHTKGRSFNSLYAAEQEAEDLNKYYEKDKDSLLEEAA